MEMAFSCPARTRTRPAASVNGGAGRLRRVTRQPVQMQTPGKPPGRPASRSDDHGRPMSTRIGVDGLVRARGTTSHGDVRHRGGTQDHPRTNVAHPASTRRGGRCSMSPTDRWRRCSGRSPHGAGRTDQAPAVVRELSVPGIGHRRQPRIPCVGGERPAVAEHHGLPAARSSWQTPTPSSVVKVLMSAPGAHGVRSRWPVGRPRGVSDPRRGPHRPHRSGDYEAAG